MVKFRIRRIFLVIVFIDFDNLSIMIYPSREKETPFFPLRTFSRGSEPIKYLPFLVNSMSLLRASPTKEALECFPRQWRSSKQSLGGPILSKFRPPVPSTDKRVACLPGSNAWPRHSRLSNISRHCHSSFLSSRIGCILPRHCRGPRISKEPWQLD